MNGLHDMNVPDGSKIGWGSLLSSTYRLYRERFWTFFWIGLPVALLTYFFPPLQRLAVGKLVFILGLRKFSQSYWVFLSLATFFTGAVYWLLSTTFFAAIAGKLINDDSEEGQALSDAYSPVRRRLPALLVVALVTWTAFHVTRVIVAMTEARLVERFNYYPGFWSLALMIGLPLAVIAGLVSRAALAVPELIADPGVSPLRAIRNSIRKMENWEPFFMFFLIKTAIVGYGVYWAAQRGFELLWAHTSISPSAYSWVTWGVYVCLFAILESPLFIAFTVLYSELALKQKETALAAPAIR